MTKPWCRWCQRKLLCLLPSWWCEHHPTWSVWATLLWAVFKRSFWEDVQAHRSGPKERPIQAIRLCDRAGFESRLLPWLRTTCRSPSSLGCAVPGRFTNSHRAGCTYLAPQRHAGPCWKLWTGPLSNYLEQLSGDLRGGNSPAHQLRDEWAKYARTLGPESFQRQESKGIVGGTPDQKQPCHARLQRPGSRAIVADQGGRERTSSCPHPSVHFRSVLSSEVEPLAIYGPCPSPSHTGRAFLQLEANHGRLSVRKPGEEP